jgi:hypothetical protein
MDEEMENEETGDMYDDFTIELNEEERKALASHRRHFSWYDACNSHYPYGFWQPYWIMFSPVIKHDFAAVVLPLPHKDILQLPRNWEDKPVDKPRPPLRRVRPKFRRRAQRATAPTKVKYARLPPKRGGAARHR